MRFCKGEVAASKSYLGKLASSTQQLKWLILNEFVHQLPHELPDGALFPDVLGFITGAIKSAVKGISKVLGIRAIDSSAISFNPRASKEEYELAGLSNLEQLLGQRFPAGFFYSYGMEFYKKTTTP
ncbi:hypothetical protein PIB30_090744 [Stylosanthes scabra]|uniref:Uncharacterized protein n=1 Tax=Stylosanthes scabra TaxID=79078 RepID=A0ABU6XWX6_9FABA|nr:hypothetical protein [Stylosanthes scabra]